MEMMSWQEQILDVCGRNGSFVLAYAPTLDALLYTGFDAECFLALETWTPLLIWPSFGLMYDSYLY